jgi:hypothetical protein
VTVSILIPWRTDHGHRERLWTHLRPLWEALPYQLCVASDGAEDGQPFDYAAAANKAAAEATGAVFITWGADQFPDPAAIGSAAERATVWGWSRVFDRNGTYSPFATEQILAGADPQHLGVELIEPHCTGIIAVRRDIWHAVGGMDERFHGWGYEDAALRDRLIRDYGKPPVRSGMLMGLWHPVRHRVYTGANADLYHREYAPGTPGGA